MLLVPQESVSSWLIDYLVTSERQSHKKHQFNDTSFVLWEVRNYVVQFYVILLQYNKLSAENNTTYF